MRRLGYVSTLACMLLVVAPPLHRAECRERTTGDICAAGSPWSEFTRFRVEPREEDAPATTLAMHDGADFSLEIEPKSPATSKGRILVIAGRAMLIKDVAQEAGYEIDALDGPVLTHQLVMTLLDQAFPKGPGSVASGKPSFKIVQKKRAMRIATSSAGGRIEAPWTLTGTARQVDGRIVYDMQLEFAAQDGPKLISFAGKTQPTASSKTLSLNYGLSISSDVYRENELTGFGLVLVKDDSSGFNWEWFDRDQGDVFRKLRGGGKVRVTVVKSEQFQELVAVEFLDDITLRCTDDQTGTTHEVRVLKGSVFRVAP